VRSYLISMLSLLLVAIRIGEVKCRYMMTDSEAYRRAVCNYADDFEKILPQLDEQMWQLAVQTREKELFDFAGSGGNLGTAWFSHAKIVECTGDAAIFSDLEAWNHMNCFFRPIDKRVIMVNANGAGPDRSRALECLESMTHIRGTVFVVTDDADMPLPEPAVRILIPKAEYDWLAPLLNYLPISLYSGYLCELKGETYGRSGQPDWSFIAGTRILTESEIVMI